MNLSQLSYLHIDEGTETSPFILTTKEVSTLYRMSLQADSTRHIIEGWVNTETGGMESYIKYQLEKTWSNLHILATPVVADWSVDVLTHSIYEGGSTSIMTTNLTSDALVCEFSLDSLQVTSGAITEAQVKQHFHVDTSQGRVWYDDATNGAGWLATFRLRFHPSYVEEPSESDYREVTMSVIAVAITGIVITCDDYVSVNGSTVIGVSTLPTNNTKKSDEHVIRLTVDGGGYITPNQINGLSGSATYFAPETNTNIVVHAALHVFGSTSASVTASRSISMLSILRARIVAAPGQTVPGIENAYISVKQPNDANIVRLKNGETMNVVADGQSAYTISFSSIEGYIGTISEEVVYPTEPITEITVTYKEFHIEEYATGVLLEQENPEDWVRMGDLNVIDRILAKYGSYVIDVDHKKMARLSASDHDKFLDGTDWDGSFGDAFRRLPKVYFKVETTDEGPVLWVSLDPISSKYFEENWIAIYRMSTINGTAANSKPSATADIKRSTPAADMNTYVRSRSTDYVLMKYREQCKLVALYYAKYGNPDSDLVLGSGALSGGSWQSEQYTRNGYTSKLGDGTGQVINKYMTSKTCNKLFGIENLVGYGSEWRVGARDDSNIYVSLYKGDTPLTSASDPYYKRFARLRNGTGNAYVSRRVLGEDFELVSTAEAGTSNTFYCDGQKAIYNGNACWATLNASNTGLYGGISAMGGEMNACGRMSFVGDISEYELISGAKIVALNTPEPEET